MGETLSRVAQEIVETVPPIMRFIREEMRRQGTGSSSLSIPQFRCLAFLGRHPGAALSEVADHLGVTPPTACVLVERLVQQGLVKREMVSGERRRHHLALTPAGGRILEEARRATQERIKAAVGKLAPAELAAVATALPLLARVFREPVPRP
ncbi:MAG TPA: winged helix-turn-helix transcriptional regulator [Firmicutes bacterium]|nr:winged helix-turn-helix transcriptional regulator [Bacillota bacterium]